MGQVITGYRESDLLVICNNTSPNIVVPFTVYECTEHSDKHKPTYQQMQRLAIEVQPTRASSKTAGFSTIGTVLPVWHVNEDEDEGEAARIR